MWDKLTIFDVFMIVLFPYYLFSFIRRPSEFTFITLLIVGGYVLKFLIILGHAINEDKKK